MVLAIKTDLPKTTNNAHAAYGIAMNDELNRYAGAEFNLAYTFPVLIPNPALVFEDEDESGNVVEKTPLVHPDNDTPRELTRLPFKDIDDLTTSRHNDNGHGRRSRSR